MRRQAGDTLVEVTMALAILSLVLLSSSVLAARAFSLGGAARQQEIAANLIQQQAEALRNYRDSNIDDQNGVNRNWPQFIVATGPLVGPFYMRSQSNSWTPAAIGAGGPFTNGIYQISITSTAVPGTSSDEMKYDITALWQSDGGAAGSCPANPAYHGNCLTITTYLSDLDNLQPCSNSVGACNPIGWTPPLPPPPLPPPAITANLTVRGTISGTDQFYDYTQGESVNIQWTSSNATACTVTTAFSGMGTGTSGNWTNYDNQGMESYPNGSTRPLTYVLTCTNSTTGATPVTQTVTATEIACYPRQYSPSYGEAPYGEYQTFGSGGVHDYPCPVQP